MKKIIYRYLVKRFLLFYTRCIQPNGIYTYPNILFLEISGEEYYLNNGFLSTWEYLFRNSFWERWQEKQNRRELAQSLIKGIDYFDDWDSLENNGFSMEEIQSYIGDEIYSKEDYNIRVLIQQKMVEIGTIFM